MICRYCGGTPTPGSYLAVGADGRTVRAAWVECPSCYAVGPLIEGGRHERAESVERRAVIEFMNEGNKKR